MKGDSDNVKAQREHPMPSQSAIKSLYPWRMMTNLSSMDRRRKRIRFRCWHRGIKETDLLLGRFADARIVALAEARLDELEALLEAPDWEVYAWVTEKTPPPAEFDTELMQMVQGFTRDNPL